MTRQEKAIISSLRKLPLDWGPLWNILTALRGPDNEDTLMKDSTTAIIRYALLGNRIGNQFGICLPDTLKAVRFRNKMDLGQHFTVHALVAFEALGLKWSKLNKIPETGLRF